MNGYGCDCAPWCKPVGGQCGVIVEMRKTPEERREEYAAKCRSRAAELDQERAEGSSPKDLPYQLRKLGVPLEAILALQQPRDRPALDAARTFVRAPSSLTVFLALIGPTGVGKTVAAAFVAQEYRRKHPPNQDPTGTPEPIIWAQAAELTSLSAFTDGDQRRVLAMENAKLVVLDDAGDEATALGLEHVRKLLHHRDATNRRTVITSNLKPDAFKARYGEAIADRIQARGIIPQLWGGKSMRTPAITEAKRGAA